VLAADQVNFACFTGFDAHVVIFLFFFFFIIIIIIIIIIIGCFSSDQLSDALCRPTQKPSDDDARRRRRFSALKPSRRMIQAGFEVDQIQQST